MAIWYRVDTSNDETTPIRILKHTNTLVRFICRFSGEERQEYKQSKFINWFEDKEKAKEFHISSLKNEILKTEAQIKELREHIKYKEQKLIDLKNE